MKSMLLIALAVVAVTGCSALQPQCTCPEPAAPIATAAPVARETEAQRRERMIWELSSKSVYFDSDSYSLKPEFHAFLKQVHAFLQSAPGISVALIGNADERGRGQMTSGQRRADAVKQTLRSMGLEEDRMEAISLGDKNPRASCHAEKCWAENRRVDIVFLGAEPPRN